ILHHTEGREHPAFGAARNTAGTPRGEGKQSLQSEKPPLCTWRYQSQTSPEQLWERRPQLLLVFSCRTLSGVVFVCSVTSVNQQPSNTQQLFRAKKNPAVAGFRGTPLNYKELRRSGRAVHAQRVRNAEAVTLPCAIASVSAVEIAVHASGQLHALEHL